MVESLDDNVGKILNALERLGIADRTAVEPGGAGARGGLDRLSSQEDGDIVRSASTGQEPIA